MSHVIGNLALSEWPPTLNVAQACASCERIFRESDGLRCPYCDKAEVFDLASIILRARGAGLRQSRCRKCDGMTVEEHFCKYCGDCRSCCSCVKYMPNRGFRVRNPSSDGDRVLFVSDRMRRLRHAREAAGMMLITLAKKLRVSKTTLSNWELGYTDPLRRPKSARQVIRAEVLLGLRQKEEQ